MPITKPIKTIKVLGVRAAEETKLMTTYNSTVYCLLVIYEDGNRSLLECTTQKMAPYVQYIEA